MRADQAAPIVNALLKGLSETLTLPVLDGLDTSAFLDTGTVKTNATGGTTLEIENIGSTAVTGQFFSLIHGGKRYLHRIAETSAITGGQRLTIFPALKVSATAGDLVEFATPKIEGFIRGNEQQWTVGLLANVGVTFEVLEHA